MDHPTDDLKATGDSLIADAARLAEIEREKRRLDPHDPKIVALSEDAEAIARDMVPKAVVQTQLSRELAEG
jgi:hypothetical protein